MRDAGASGPAPLVGISSCLLGLEVRYDGGHKLDRMLLACFGTRVRWMPVCPEAEVGMGTPREPIHLVREGGVVRLVGVDCGRDWTGAMRAWAERRVDELATAGVCGFVLKARSPSCGLAGVPLRGSAGVVAANGRGFFAEALVTRLPGLPVAEAEELHDAEGRERFLELLLAYPRRHRAS